MTQQPYLITLPKVAGKSGSLSFMDEHKDLPISIKRIYWIYDVEEGTERGDHAHLNSDRILVCVKGSLRVRMEDPTGRVHSFHLNDPSQALFFPRNYWINITFANDSILFVACSLTFKDDLVIADYQQFKKMDTREYVH